MSKGSLFTLLVSLVLAATLSGCNKVADEVAKSPSNRDQPVSAPVAAQEPTTEYELRDKLDPYVQCLNAADRPILDNAKNYHQIYADAIELPSKKHFDGRFDGFHPIDDTNYEQTRSCVSTLRENAKKSPSIPNLDKAVTEYASALETLIPLMSDADHYYKQQENSDDKLAKGRALNDKLQPQLNRLYELSNLVRSEVVEQKHKQSLMRLARMERTDGKNFPWHAENVMMIARRSFDASRDAESGEVDSETLADAEASMQQAYDAARAYGQAHRDEKSTSGHRPMWFQLDHSAQAYLKSLKSIRRAAGGENGVTSAKTQEFERSFNALIIKFNTLQDQEDQASR
jgi:hypothetical protein